MQASGSEDLPSDSEECPGSASPSPSPPTSASMPEQDEAEEDVPIDIDSLTKEHVAAMLHAKRSMLESTNVQLRQRGSQLSRIQRTGMKAAKKLLANEVKMLEEAEVWTAVSTAAPGDEGVQPFSVSERDIGPSKRIFPRADFGSSTHPLLFFD
eukprot:scaffold8582_cov325-Pinguiococcus_pyrenoidosus.AAC.1